jgi:hypothetical protein
MLKGLSYHLLWALGGERIWWRWGVRSGGGIGLGTDDGEANGEEVVEEATAKVGGWEDEDEGRV